jgi:carbon-monoxide dehydrogenase small subunit
MMIAAVDLLAHNPNPTDQEIKEGISGNLCRCTGYVKQIEAIRIAAEKMRKGADV